MAVYNNGLFDFTANVQEDQDALDSFTQVQETQQAAYDEYYAEYTANSGTIVPFTRTVTGIAYNDNDVATRTLSANVQFLITGTITFTMVGLAIDNAYCIFTLSGTGVGPDPQYFSFTNSNEETGANTAAVINISTLISTSGTTSTTTLTMTTSGDFRNTGGSDNEYNLVYNLQFVKLHLAS